VLKQAEIERRRIEMLAEAQKQKLILEADGQAASTRATGEAEERGGAICEVGTSVERPTCVPLFDVCRNPCCRSFGKEGLTSSSQVNIEKSSAQIM